MKLKIKNPAASIVLSKKEYEWLEKIMKKNDRRKKLTSIEKEVIEEGKAFSKSLAAWLNGPTNAPIIYPISKRKKNS